MKKKLRWWIPVAVAVVLIVAAVLWFVLSGTQYTKDPGKAGLAYVRLIHDGKTEEAMALLPETVVSQYLQRNQRDSKAWHAYIDQRIQSEKKYFESNGWPFDEKLLEVYAMSETRLNKLKTTYLNDYGVTITDGKFARVAENTTINGELFESPVDVPMIQIDGLWYVDFLNAPDIPDPDIFAPVNNIGTRGVENYITAVRENKAETLLNCYPTAVMEKWLQKNNTTREALRAHFQSKLDAYNKQLRSENKAWRYGEEWEPNVIPLEEWYALQKSYQTEFGVEMQDAYKTTVEVPTDRYSSVTLKDVYVVKIGGEWYLDLLNPPALPLGNIFETT